MSREKQLEEVIAKSIRDFNDWTNHGGTSITSVFDELAKAIEPPFVPKLNGPVYALWDDADDVVYGKCIGIENGQYQRDSIIAYYNHCRPLTEEERG
jgi:hypothetical protein